VFDGNPVIPTHNTMPIPTAIAIAIATNVPVPGEPELSINVAEVKSIK
jgi:hypothetical protein